MPEQARGDGPDEGAEPSFETAYLTGDASRAAPASIGTKFDAAGRPLRDPGNTVICHLDPDGTAHAALRAIQDALRAAPEGTAFTFLPPDSLHMTLFEGVIEHEREAARWPSGLPPDAPVEAVTQALSDRLAGIALPQRFGLRPVALFAGLGLILEGATEADEAALREARDRLAEATGLRKPDHDFYIFHVTLAYPLRFLDPGEAARVVARSEGLLSQHAADLAAISLGPPEWCRFETMHRFERLCFL